MISVFANAKAYVPLDNIAHFFVSFDIGGAYGVCEGLRDCSGMMITPAAGILIDNTVSLSIGYDIQKFEYDLLPDYKMKVNAVTFKLGWMF